MRNHNPSGFYAAFFLVLLFTAFTAAQTPTPKPRFSSDDTIKVDSRLIMVPVSVTDAAGRAITGLTSADFKISEENQPQTIESVRTADQVPLEIVLLFDISASTDTMFKFEQDTAAKFLHDVMRPIDRATVFTIGARPMLVQPRETAENAAARVRAIVPTKEFTAFYDSVSAAAEYLKRNAPEGTRRVIVVISDGEDTNSERIANAIQDGYKKLGKQIDTIDRKALYQLTVANRNAASDQERLRVLKSLQNADSVFYSINPAGNSYQLNQMSVFGQENMQRFAVDTGGVAFAPKFLPTELKDEKQNDINRQKNQDLLENIFQQVGNELRSQYVIQYYSEKDFPLNKFVKLDVSLQNKPDLHIRSRQGYYVKK